MSRVKAELSSRQNEVEFLQGNNNKLRSELLEKTKLQIDIEGLQNRVLYFEKENSELKQHLENICRSYDEAID